MPLGRLARAPPIRRSRRVAKRLIRKANRPARRRGHGRFLSSHGDIDNSPRQEHQRINGEINAPEIRLVGEEGEQLGIVPLADALAKAEAAELDLVEIAPTAKPPVCRIMDYGKFKYRESEEAARGEAQAEADPGQGSQVPARHRRRRLPDQAAESDPVPGRRRQGEDHAALPRARDGAPGIRRAPAGTDSRTISSRIASSSRFRGSRAGKW